MENTKEKKVKLMEISETLLFKVTMQQTVNEDSTCERITLGYFAMRGKAQICRLLCEYLQLQYQDLCLTPWEWEQYQRTQAANWVIKALPFLKDGDFVVTGAQGIAEYLIRKSGRTDLLGASLRDRIRIDMIKSKHDIKDSVIGLICQLHRTDRVESPQHPPEYYWKGKIEPRLMEIEAACCQGEWFFGYLTIVDFIFYELVNNLEWLFPQLDNFPKLTQLRNRLRSIPTIRDYQNSARSLKVYDPVLFFKSSQKQGSSSNLSIQ